MSQWSSNQLRDGDSTCPKIEISQILPFLYLGCQDDAISTKTIQDHHITHVINVSKTGERASFLDENDDEHFLRIPINDCHNAQLRPYFDSVYTFIEKARLDNGRVLIHCLAGISRSPALAIAYIMRYLHMSSEDAYRFVKQRRAPISPNFNFLGQLSEYERSLELVSESVSQNTRPVMKCCVLENPVNNRRRCVQVEGRSNTRDLPEFRTTSSLPRPTSFNVDLNIPSQSKTRSSTLSPMTNLLIDTSSESSLVPRTLPRPQTISIKTPESPFDSSRLTLFNSSCDDLRSNDSRQKLLNNTERSPFMEPTNLINTYLQHSSIVSEPLKSWESTSSIDLPSNTSETISNVLTSSHKLTVL